jgi:hypothetical protein
MKVELIKLHPDRVHEGFYSIVFEVNGFRTQTNTIHRLPVISERLGMEISEIKKKIKK